MNIDYIINLWKEATGIDNSTHIRLGVDSDSVCHKAIKSLKDDPSGLLAILFMRKAFNSLIKETKFTLEDVMNNVDISRFLKLKDALYSGEYSEICDAIINGLIKNIQVLGKNYTYNEIINTNSFYEVVADAVQEFNNPWKMIHEQHNDGSPIACSNAKVLPKLYRFEHLKLFVDALKTAPEDNFACVSIIDRTFETCDCEYDEKFDKFFCIGIKNNGVVYTISDRIIIRANDSHTYKHRNPGREYGNKVDYSWLPYCKMNDILTNIDTSRLLTDGTNTNNLSSTIGGSFDDEGVVYMGMLLTLAYHKYFASPEEISAKRVFFSNDVQFLPATSCKSVVVANQVQIPMPRETVKSINSPDKVYTNNLYDYYIDKYPLGPLPPMPSVDKLSTLEEYRRQAWWRVRKAQAQHIEENLQQSIKSNLDNVQSWLQGQINKNIDSIIKYMLTTIPYDDFMQYDNPDAKNSDKKIFWKEFAAGNDVPASALYYEEKYDIVEPRYYEYVNNSISRRKDHRNLSKSYILNTDCKSRKWQVKLILRSHTDLEKFFNLTNEELPEDIRRWFNPRSHSWGTYSWKPYSGNSILDVTDPMNDINNPWENEFTCCINLYVSKSMLKKYHPKWFDKNPYVDTIENN